MQLLITGRVLEVYQGEKSTIVTLNDTQEGGQLKLSFPQGQQVAMDSLLEINAVVKPGIGQFGQFLKVKKLVKEGGK